MTLRRACVPTVYSVLAAITQPQTSHREPLALSPLRSIRPGGTTQSKAWWPPRDGSSKAGMDTVGVEYHSRYGPRWLRTRLADTRPAGETFISPASQREQILKWAEATGARLARIYEELDESGARADRPILAEVLARVEAGVSEGIVVAAFDRFGRSLLESLASIERIQSAGGTFVSVREGLDLTTDTGRLVLRIMLSMAEWELHRLRGRWNSARERAVARGVHMGVHPPTGYFRDCERRLHPDPQSGPIITEVFARRAAGSTIKELALFLKDRAIPHPPGMWTGRRPRCMPSSRTACIWANYITAASSTVGPI